jgi:hypothetical protein
MGTRLSRLLLAATLLAPVTAAVPARAAGAGAPCDVIDFSPSFVSDHTAICAHQSVTYKKGPVVELSTFALGAIEVYVTTDSGRTWRKQESTGLPYDATSDTGETLNTVQFSPNYPTDKLVYCYVGGYGLYVSADLGASWQWLDALLLGPGPVNHDALTPFTPSEPSPDGGGAPGGFAYAYGAGITLNGQPAPINSLLVPPVQTQVQGGPGLTAHFLMPPAWPRLPAFAVTYTGADDSMMALYECDSALRCLTRGFNAGPKADISRAWMASDYLTSHTVYVVSHRDDGKRYRTLIHRSTDAGAHFSVWQPAQRLVPQPYAVVNLGFDAAHPRSMWLRTVGADGTDRLYVSADGGAHWTRRTGRTPYNRLWGWGYQKGGLWRRGSRLYTLGAHQTGLTKDHWPRYDYAGVYCSVDDGRTWARTCAR